jgi:D-sedoheptulose 7-phosphate isomerase
VTNSRSNKDDIRCLVLDIDGVLTDGGECLGLGSPKSLFLRDLDALAVARENGLVVSFLSGEAEIEDVVERCGGGEALAGAKDKRAGLEELARMLDLEFSKMCYVGDADRDAPALELAGLGLAPFDASQSALLAADRVLRASGGRGAVAEAVEIVLRLRDLGDLSESVRNATQSSIDALERSMRDPEALSDSLRPIAETLTVAIERGSKVLLFGNGGSAAMAQHAAAELVGRFRCESGPLPAIALSTDTSVVTALANDYSFDEVFARQVRGHGRPGDVAVGFSTSGESANVIGGLDAARELRMTTLGFTGSDARTMEPHCDSVFEAPSDDVPRIQELHLWAWHVLCEVLENVRIPVTPAAEND